jgi:multidrug efflux system outer membrane protein
VRNLLSLSLLLTATGCAVVGPDYVEPESVVELSNQFSNLVTEQGNAFYRSVAPDVMWWKSLNDPTLDSLISLALENNTDLRISMANLSSARAVLTESETGLQPQVDLEGSVQAERMAGFQRGSNDEAADDNLVTSIGIGLGWELDLFGRVQRAVESAQRNIQMETALLADMQRIIISDVASAYIDYRGAQQQKLVIEKNITNQAETLDITSAMEQEGLSTGLDISRAQAQLMSTKAQLPSVYAQLASGQNRLATLTAQQSNQIATLLSSNNELPKLPAFISIGDPASLIRRRPDIKAAERRLAAYTSQVGVATAELFPTVTLNGSFGFASDQPSDLTASGAPNYSIGPAISWNLFNRDAIRARIKQAESNVDAQLARYDQTVLVALEEVNTSLVEHFFERQRNQALTATVEASQQSVELVRNRYNAGAESFLGVLDAERTLLASEQQLTDSNIALNQSLIHIYKAVSGGWTSSE